MTNMKQTTLDNIVATTRIVKNIEACQSNERFQLSLRVGLATISLKQMSVKTPRSYTP